jgi:hypothetical protein
MGDYKMLKKEFEEISIPKWKLAVSAASKIYRVFKSPTEFETVEAESASEAVQKLGIKNVYKVKFGAMDNMTQFEQAMLTPFTA